MPRLHRIAVLGLLICATAALLAASLNSDAAYVLVAARRMLAGERLYVDLIEVNPPLIFWLMTIPAAAGRVVALSDARLIALFMAAALWVSAALTAWVFSRTPDSSRLLRSAVLGSYLAAAVLMALSQVGQREQLTAILLLPYAVLAARAGAGHPSPLRMGVACGVAAGLGLAIKPFFVVPWMAMELAVFVMQGRSALIRPEVVAAAVTQGLYAVAVLVFTTEYITDVVPLVSAWYGAYETGRFSIMTGSRVLLLATIGLAGIVVPAWLPAGMAPACARVFGASTLGWVVVFVGQGKGWLYQLLPGEVSAAAALAALGVSVWDGARGWRIRRAWLLAAPLAVMGVVALAGRTPSSITGLAREVRGLLVAPTAPDWFVAMVGTIQQRAPGQPVYVMSTSVWPAFPVVNVAGAPWPYHYHFLWPIPSLYAGPGGAAYRPPERQDAKEREFFSTVVGDLIRVPPKLLFVEHGAALQGMAGRPFDFVEYFSGSREFRTLFQRYRRLDDIGKWATYELQ